jgi:diguanylate cyclase (GGDEF)-like protein/PAS domain S-box-containing protein
LTAVFDDPDVYRTLLDSIPTGVYLVDRESKVVLFNSAAERITGYLRQDILGRSCKDDFLGHADADNMEISGDATPLAVVLRDGKPVNRELSLRRKSGERVPVRSQAALVRDAHGKVIGAVESFEEVQPSENWSRRRDKLAEFGCLDQASGVLNHGMVESHLREMLATYAEHPVPFSILCIGIDDLEKLKATHGPGALALVLRAVGQTLENSLRPTDFIGRWQENEFLAILSECKADEVIFVGARLGRMVRQSRIEWWGDMLNVSISMGAADVLPGDTVAKMMNRAEIGLRESIAKGGNQFVRRDDRASESSEG